MPRRRGRGETVPAGAAAGGGIAWFMGSKDLPWRKSSTPGRAGATAGVVEVRAPQHKKAGRVPERVAYGSPNAFNHLMLGLPASASAVRAGTLTGQEYRKNRPAQDRLPGIDATR